MVKVKNDLSGKKFGRLTVIEQSQDHVTSRGKHQAMWLCQCDCGNIKEVAGYQLTSNRIKSCGCLALEIASVVGKSKARDLVGKKFGRLRVIERAENIGSHIAWKCLCDCGNEKVVTGNNLKNGSTKSCGCYLSEKSAQIGKNNLIDLSGQRFGWLNVLNSELDTKGRLAWRCRCDCGNEVVVQGTNLRRGITKSCGCYAKIKSSESNLIDITGNKYNHLAVIKRVGNIGKAPAWQCLCDCGNTIVVRGDYLRGGNVDCCESCSNKKSRCELIDLTGCKFGFWTVLDKSSNDKKGTYWNCRCVCGKEKAVLSSSLRRGASCSCGCSKFSKGETQILKYLMNKKIKFEAQKRFLDCRDKKPLPFDFYLPDYNMCIEYDGRQHFDIVDFTSKDMQSARLQYIINQKHDFIKNEYCKDKNIMLLRIPYFELNNIENVLEANLNLGSDING